MEVIYEGFDSAGVGFDSERLNISLLPFAVNFNSVSIRDILETCCDQLFIFFDVFRCFDMVFVAFKVYELRVNHCA